MAGASTKPDGISIKGTEMFTLIISNKFPHFEKFHENPKHLRKEKGWTWNPYREGADKDVENLKKMLTQDLGCPDANITTVEDKRAQDLNNAIDEFCAKVSQSNDAKCLFIFAASHGDSENKFLTDFTLKEYTESYFGEIHIPNIWTPIVNRFGSKLVIVFFFQCCRGDLLDAGQKVRNNTQQAGTTNQAENGSYGVPEVDPRNITPGINFKLHMPDQPDVLLAFATTYDYASFRNTKTGSYFLEKLCATFKTRDKKKDLVKILTEVNREVAKVDIQIPVEINKVQVMQPKKQCLSVQSSLTKKIYFTHGQQQ